MYSTPQSSKRASAAASYTSSTWSANSPSTAATTPATVAMAWTPRTPPYQLPMTPPSSGGPSSRTYTTYGVPGTPGAPMMNTVPLPPSHYHNLPTPPTSPQSSRVSLHHLIDHRTMRQNLYFDIRTSMRPLDAEFEHFLSAYAVNSVTTHMVLIVAPELNWQINVVNPTGVTIHDVLANLYNFLRQHPSTTEYQAYPFSAQQRVSHSFAQRTAQARDSGIRRFDALCVVNFAGISPSQDGRWFVNFV